MIHLVKVEGTLEELRALFLESAAKEAKRTARRAGKASVQTAEKAVKKAVKRAPSAYNKFIGKELKRLKKKHPRTPQAQLMKKAAAAWRKKKRGKK